MEVDNAVRRYLRSLDVVKGYVGTTDSGFADRVYRQRLEEPVDGTGNRAIVVKRMPGWAKPDSVTTQEYPVVLIEFHADNSRDANGEYDRLDNADNAMAMYRGVDPFLHGKRGVVWGTLTVVTSARWAEPFTVTQEDTHGYERRSLGDTAIVVVQYALQVVHSTAA